MPRSRPRLRSKLSVLTTSRAPRPRLTAEPSWGIWPPNMGTDTMSGMNQIWGQTRCPVYRSGTFNVQRTTLNVQGGDRKGAWRAGYGDRHEVCRLAEHTEGQTRYSTRTWGQARCPVYRSARSTSNVQLSTFNGVTERVHNGPDMGTDTGFGGQRWK